MSSCNGVIRIGHKGLKKFAFGDGDPFEVDVVTAFQAWINIDEQFRERAEPDHEGRRNIPVADMAEYHTEAVKFVSELARDRETMVAPVITTAEALDFLARLREQYDEVADFFLPRSPEKLDLPDSSEVELRFSAEGS